MSVDKTPGIHNCGIIIIVILVFFVCIKPSLMHTWLVKIGESDGNNTVPFLLVIIILPAALSAVENMGNWMGHSESRCKHSSAHHHAQTLLSSPTTTTVSSRWFVSLTNEIFLLKVCFNISTRILPHPYFSI